MLIYTEILILKDRCDSDSAAQQAAVRGTLFIDRL
jgi:hypothetical protein